jgi:hypothetical protein
MYIIPYLIINEQFVTGWPIVPVGIVVRIWFNRFRLTAVLAEC